MVTRFYFHDATSTNTGTMPGAGTSASSTVPDWVYLDGLMRAMDGTIGTAQTSKGFTTAAQTTTQAGMIVRFVSAPIAAQSLASQGITYSAAHSESSTSSDFLPSFVLSLWRPSSGAYVATLYDGPSGLLFLEPGTSETATSGSRTATAATAQDGDILVLEVWRAPNTQAMATGYTNTVYYDGTTVSSATTNAAYIEFTNDVALLANPNLDNTAEGTSGTTVSTSNSAGPNQFNAITGTPAYDNTVASAGSTAIKFGPSKADRIDWIGAISSYGAVANIYTRMYVRLTGVTGADANLVVISTASGLTNARATCVVTSRTMILVSQSGTTVATGAVVIPVNQWVRFEFDVTSNSGTTANFTSRLYLTPGSSTPDETLTTTGTPVNGLSGQLRLGPNTASVTTTTWLDDIAVRYAGPVGPVSSGAAVRTNPRFTRRGAVLRASTF